MDDVQSLECLFFFSVRGILWDLEAVLGTKSVNGKGLKSGVERYLGRVQNLLDFLERVVLLPCRF